MPRGKKRVVEVTIATTENQMDSHAVTACLPWASEGERAKERTREDTFTTIVTTAAATYIPIPVRVSRRGAGRLANGIMLNPRRGKFATRRRDVYLRAVSSSREICAYNLHAFSGWQFDQDRESRRRADDSLRSLAFSYGKYAHRFARNQAFIYVYISNIYISMCKLYVV